MTTPLSSRVVLLLNCVLLSAVSMMAQIQPADDAPQPLSPEESAQRMRLPDGFRIELVASEPVVEEPSCVAFDEHGRMFVCELHGYNIEGHIDTQELNKTGKLDTKVRRLRWELMGGKTAEEAAKQQYGTLKMLVDSDGDGVMDKAEVWADDLPPCYGVVPALGGVIVTCAPHILFFADRDGDGKADVRETLFTGFKIHVLERGINNPQWGFDNWIYVGSGGDGSTITGAKLKSPVELGSSDFRIKPDGSAIEPVNGRVGTFGMTINDAGDRFPSTGGRPAIYALPLPYRYLARNPYVATPATNHTAAGYDRGFRISAPHPWRVKRGKDPNWVKFYGNHETTSIYFSGGCSTTFYGDTLFPKQYQGNLFYCEPSLNIVHRTVLRRDGAGYVAERSPGEEESEFLASTDQWFRPMNLRVGPEGALYIVDMYREIIEDYSAIPRFLQQQYGLDKGKNYGRIWRLLPTTVTTRPIPNFARLNDDDLAVATGDTNPWRRLTAQRLLIERNANTAAVGRLKEQLHDEGSTPQAVVHSLYSMDALGVLEPSDVAAALHHGHYSVRIHGLRLIKKHWFEIEEQLLLPRLLELTDDEDPSVRLQLAMTLGDVSGEHATEALLSLAQQHGNERWMQAAILSSSNNPDGGKLLVDLISQPELSEGARSMLAPLSATAAGRRDIPTMSAILTNIFHRDAQIQKACLVGLVEGISRGDALGKEDANALAPIVPLLKSDAAEIRDLATKFAAHVPFAEITPLRKMFAEAARTALDGNAEVEQRRKAAQVLAAAPYDLVVPAAAALLDATQPPALQESAIDLLSYSSDKRVGSALLQSWPGLSPKIRQSVLNALFTRENRLPALLEALENGIVHRGDISAVQRDQLTGNGDSEVAARAGKLFENAAADVELQRRIDQFQNALAGERNLERGKQVYLRTCLVCHKLGNAGNEVGPALGTITGKPDETILLDILDPSGKIEPEYKLYLVTTTSGESFAGVLASESPTSVTLRKADGSSDVILRKDVENMTASEVSLMPANLHDAMSPQEAADLIGFMRVAFGRKASE